MDVKFYINHDKMQILRQKGNTFTGKTIELETGTIVNGSIINSEEIVRRIKELGYKITRAVIVVDSSNLMVKKLNPPKLPKNKLLNIIASEFDVDDDEYYFDCNPVSSSGEVIACAVPKEFINKYTEIFNFLGIKIERIDIALNGIIKYVKQNKVLAKKTFILNVMMEHTLVSILFDKGEYKFSNRNRMLHEETAESYVNELYSKLTTMVQFAQSLNLDTPIEQSTYIGLSDEIMQRYAHYIQQVGYDILVDNLRDSNVDMRYIYAYTGFNTNKDDINLCRTKRVAKPRERFEVVAMQIGGPLVLMAMVFLIYMDIASQNLVIENQIAKIDTFLNDPTIAEEVALLTEARAANEMLKTHNMQYSIINKLISNSTIMPRDVLDFIYDEENGYGVTINDFSFSPEDQVLQIMATADTDNGATVFSRYMRETFGDEHLFYGYSFTGSNAGDSEWKFETETKWYKQ